MRMVGGGSYSTTITITQEDTSWHLAHIWLKMLERIANKLFFNHLWLRLTMQKHIWVWAIIETQILHFSLQHVMHGKMFCVSVCTYINRFILEESDLTKRKQWIMPLLIRIIQINHLRIAVAPWWVFVVEIHKLSFCTCLTWVFMVAWIDWVGFLGLTSSSFLAWLNWPSWVSMVGAVHRQVPSCDGNQHHAGGLHPDCDWWWKQLMMVMVMVLMMMMMIMMVMTLDLIDIIKAGHTELCPLTIRLRPA